jgi:hypothetical protein
MFDRSTTYLVVTFVALVVPAPVSAQGLPGSAEPSGGSEPRESRFHEREGQRERPEREVRRSRQRPLGPGYQTDPLGPQRQGIFDIIGCFLGSERSCKAACEEDAEPGTEAYEWCQRNGYLPADEVPVDDYLPLLALAGIAFGVIRLRS